MKRKRSILYISSSSSSDEDEEEEEEEDDEYEVEEEDDDEDDEEEGEVEETDDDEDDEEKSEVEEIDDDESEYEEISEDEEKEPSNVVDEDDEALCKHVISLLREGKDLESLSLKECKAYLRKHGVRLAGSKAVCIHRIEEHWRINKGNAESLYPRSSFVINCTGDVCKGDVVLFRQKVYEKFDKVTRNGNVLGMRTVAGRVVKESYGSARQQHTFTVEVLWSKGTKQLSPLFPLLVKGRNLYKLKTFRQPWNNEAERIQVLAEKHRRGTAARAVRAMKRSKKNQSVKGQHLNEGRKHQKCSHHRRPSQTKRTAELSKGKHAYGRKENTSLQRRKATNHQQESSSSRQLNLKGNIRPDVGNNPIWRHPNRGHINMEVDPSVHSHTHTRQAWQMEFLNQNLPSEFAGHDFSSSSTMVSPHHLRPYADASMMPALQHQESYYRNDSHHHQSNPSHSRKRNHFPELIDAERQSYHFSRVMESNGQSTRGFQRFHSGVGRFGR